MKGGWAHFFWFRFLWGLFLLPFVLFYVDWREGKSGEYSVPIILFFVGWEIVVIALAKWRGIWPFKKD
ncbi:MAG: hypothetical protein M3273_00470 [Actinomycetota bacterium]|nr:hypothetical protein [Actinomycetota bacterium]